jgi:NAD(P)H-flavin reductase
MFLKTHDHPEGELVTRKYTPISLSSQTEALDFIFKIYRPNQHPNFPNGGKMTPELEKLQIGDTVDVTGPLGKFGY